MDLDAIQQRWTAANVEACGLWGTAAVPAALADIPRMAVEIARLRAELAEVTGQRDDALHTIQALTGGDAPDEVRPETEPIGAATLAGMAAMGQIRSRDVSADIEEDE